MKPVVLIAGIFAVIALAGGLFMLKNAVEERRERLTGIQNRIHEDRKAIGLLQTEWTHLSSPVRIQALSDRILALRSLAPAQIIESASQVPPRTGRVMAAAPDAATATAEREAKAADPGQDGSFATRMQAAINAQEGTR